MSEQVAIRPHQAADKDFIFHSWLKAYKRYSHFARRIPHNIFFRFHHAILERLLSRPSVSVLIAHPEGEPDVIIGYLASENEPQFYKTKLIHFIYVKSAFRNLGIATALLKEAQINPDESQFTHWTFCHCEKCEPYYERSRKEAFVNTDWITRKFPDIRYNPYLI